MANLGHKVWATNDIVTAVDLNGYLADQVVMYFANDTARTAGITYPVEGMVTYLGDSNSLWHYDGSSWVGIPTAATGTAATAENAIRVGGSKVFIQSGTPTAEATDDLWFY